MILLKHRLIIVQTIKNIVVISVILWLSRGCPLRKRMIMNTGIYHWKIADSRAIDRIKALCGDLNAKQVRTWGLKYEKVRFMALSWALANLLLRNGRV